MKVLKILGGIAVGVGAIAAAPFTGGGSLLAGAAALGLGTTAAVVGAVVAGAAGGGIVNYFVGNDKVNTLGVIGMKSSGKTTMLNNLRGIKTVPQTTYKESYESFKFELNNGKTISIDKGNDIGGSKNFMIEYKEIINKNEVILFFFNVSDYLTKIEYKRECNSRLEFIYNDLKNKKTAIIASHADVPNRSKIILEEEILNQVRDKKYSNLFNNGFYVVNLTNNEEFKQLINKIF
jgi:hypothetical protein